MHRVSSDVAVIWYSLYHCCYKRRIFYFIGSNPSWFNVALTQCSICSFIQPIAINYQIPFFKIVTVKDV